MISKLEHVGIIVRYTTKYKCFSDDKKMGVALMSTAETCVYCPFLKNTLQVSETYAVVLDIRGVN